eukprot:SAG31_NODE_4_length_45662_cov_15.654622_16_plen_147_part_00
MHCPKFSYSRHARLRDSQSTWECTFEHGPYMLTATIGRRRTAIQAVLAQLRQIVHDVTCDTRPVDELGDQLAATRDRLVATRDRPVVAIGLTSTPWPAVESRDQPAGHDAQHAAESNGWPKKRRRTRTARNVGVARHHSNLGLIFV